MVVFWKLLEKPAENRTADSEIENPGPDQRAKSATNVGGVGAIFLATRQTFK